MLSGLINIYKISGMTSQRVVSAVKHIFKDSGIDFGNKVGHLGTLDPDAEGVLPIAFGRATRLFDYFLDKTKVYYTVFKFGVLTDTLDAGGEVLALDENADIELPKIEDVVPKLLGKVAQIPPIYSAKSIDGVRAYKLARNGISIELKPKEVEINSIDLLEKVEKNTFSMRISCGGGTYIRSIARDMGEALNTYGTMQYLRREQSGIFDINTAKKLEEIKENPSKYILPLDFALESFAKVDGDLFAERLLNGVPVEMPNIPSDEYFVIKISGETIGIAKHFDDGVRFVTRLV